MGDLIQHVAGRHYRDGATRAILKSDHDLLRILRATQMPTGMVTTTPSNVEILAICCGGVPIAPITPPNTAPSNIPASPPNSNVRHMRLHHTFAARPQVTSIPPPGRT